MADSLSRRQVIGIGAAVAGAAVAAPILANTARAGTGAPGTHIRPTAGRAALPRTP